MRRKTLVRVLALGMVLASVTVASALTGTWDRRTYFTFSGPVAVPHATLPAGKYLFRLVDTSSRDVMQVLTADGKTAYSMTFVRRARNFEPISKPTIEFLETAEGQPPAVGVWYYPGLGEGYELVYPKEQLRLLRTPVPPTTPPAVARNNWDWLVEYMKAHPVAPLELKAEEPAPAPFLVGEVTEEPLPAYEAQPAELPKTASSTPLVALTGATLLLAVALIKGVRLLRG